MELSAGHLILVLLVVMILFGAGKLPEVGSALGKGIREFKKAMNDMDKPEPPRALDQPDKAEPIQVSVNEGFQEKAPEESAHKAAPEP